MDFNVKEFFSSNKYYVITISLFTVLNTIIIGYRSDNRVDFNTLLSGYERENLSLRSANKALRIDLLSAKSIISECMDDLNDARIELDNCLKSK